MDFVPIFIVLVKPHLKSVYDQLSCFRMVNVYTTRDSPLPCLHSEDKTPTACINYCFLFLVKAAILNVEIGTLFDPEVASKLKGSEETCIKCSQRINELVEKPIDLSASEDVEMNEPLAN